jgi:hypothetical protein
MRPEDVDVNQIPPDAVERIASSYPNGLKERVEYYVGKERVGIRWYDADGVLGIETGWKGDVKHGWEFLWYSQHKLTSAEPYENGLVHGTAYQWTEAGRLLGAYTMEHGTGLDLWWNEWTDDTEHLTEVYHYVDGLRHGFEWHLTAGELWQERHLWQGELHGVEREWWAHWRLRRGFPRYWINGVRVDKRKYLRAAAKDPTLPPFRVEENLPIRDFPDAVSSQLHGYTG